jgi:aconitate hydratase
LKSPQEKKFMSKTLAEKVIAQHLADGKMQPGEQVGLRIDHTLTQDSTGTLAYLEFEAIGVPHDKTKLSLSFVDHNMLQNDFRNADDHRYLQDVAAKYGIVFSRPGNGICHQIHLERFARPGYTLLGSDSHTPTAGGIGMIAIGAGGLDVAAAMAGEPFYLQMPSVMGVNLAGALSPFVSAKDVILAVLKKLTVKGGVNKILEYFGSGVKTLSVPERATITNMGTETGATTSIFPSDEVTRAFLRSQGRENQWVELTADEGAKYGEVLNVNLGEIEPLIALPHSPDNVKPVSEVEGTPVDQICIGSCTNSSLRDLKTVAALLKGKKISDRVSLTISPGSRQVLENLAASGDLVDIISAGARILENACGPCIGIGQAPKTDAVSIRTFNRNFKGRSGTQSAQVYLASPETAVAAAVYGEITDPRKLGNHPEINVPSEIKVDDSMFIFPEKPFTGEVRRGPNIKPLPNFPPIPDRLTGEVLLKLGDNVSTDDILPGGSEVMSLRSNIPEISKHAFRYVDPGFADRALKRRGGFIVGSENYGQGSSREHAALAPKYLGVKAVIAKSFARIHLANLINFGIAPLTFVDSSGYIAVAQGDVLEIDVKGLKRNLCVKNVSKSAEIKVELDLSDREKNMLKLGGKLAAIKAKHTTKKKR